MTPVTADRLAAGLNDITASHMRGCMSHPTWKNHGYALWQRVIDTGLTDAVVPQILEPATFSTHPAMNRLRYAQGVDAS